MDRSSNIACINLGLDQIDLDESDRFGFGPDRSSDVVATSVMLLEEG